jgi:hypothetical protein
MSEVEIFNILAPELGVRSGRMAMLGVTGPPPHLFLPPQVVVSPRRQMDVPDRPGQWSSDFEGCVS